MGEFVAAARLEDDLKASAELRAFLRAAAEAGADAARAHAAFPRIAEGIEVEETDEGLRIVSNDWISNFWEYGTVNNPAVPFLRPAAEATFAEFKSE